MLPAPPSFGSRDYWNQRFTSNPKPFEWLEAPTALDPYLVDALKESCDSDPQLLHIGCGTSLLSYHLRAHVENPAQIHNLDYSDVAIEVGKKRELEIFKAETAGSDARTQGHNGRLNGDGSYSRQPANKLGEKKESDSVSTTGSPPFMRWSSANLLDHASLLRVCAPSTYSIIVDKSTSDSIACSDDLYVPLPYHVVTSSKRSSETALAESPEPLHPLHIMAVHLALVAKPRARWIALSYSTDRYPFLPSNHMNDSRQSTTEGHASKQGLQMVGENGDADDDMSLDDDLDDIPTTVIEDGFPDPNTLWKLVGKYDIEATQSQDASSGNGVVHGPKLTHWIYVLERTEVPLFIRDT